MSSRAESEAVEIGAGDDPIAAGVGSETLDIGPREDATDLERECWATLDEIPDPHIPLSLVEMAMIYDVSVADDTAVVEMTFPCMGCPAYEFIHDDIRAGLRTIRGIRAVEIDVVWEPIWSKDLLTADARRKLNEAGIGI